MDGSTTWVFYSKYIVFEPFPDLSSWSCSAASVYVGEETEQNKIYTMIFFLTLFSHVFCALILIITKRALALNIGPDYAHPIEDLDKDLPFSQPVTFAHLEWQRCLAQSHETPLDIAILGFPYDTSTSYRSGARFGPRGIRSGSSREKKGRSYNTVWGVDPYEEGLEIVRLHASSSNPSYVIQNQESNQKKKSNSC